MFGSMQMAVSRVIKLQHHRIAQVLEPAGAWDSPAYAVRRCGAGQSQPGDPAFPPAPDTRQMHAGAWGPGEGTRPQAAGPASELVQSPFTSAYLTV